MPTLTTRMDGARRNVTVREPMEGERKAALKEGGTLLSRHSYRGLRGRSQQLCSTIYRVVLFFFFKPVLQVAASSNSNGIDLYDIQCHVFVVFLDCSFFLLI